MLQEAWLIGSSGICREYRRRFFWLPTKTDRSGEDSKKITEVVTASQLEVLHLIALERLDLAQILDPWTLGTLSVNYKK